MVKMIFDVGSVQLGPRENFRIQTNNGFSVVVNSDGSATLCSHGEKLISVNLINIYGALNNDDEQ